MQDWAASSWTEPCRLPGSFQQGKLSASWCSTFVHCFSVSEGIARCWTHRRRKWARNESSSARICKRRSLSGKRGFQVSLQYVNPSLQAPSMPALQLMAREAVDLAYSRASQLGFPWQCSPPASHVILWRSLLLPLLLNSKSWLGFYRRLQIASSVLGVKHLRYFWTEPSQAM